MRPEDLATAMNPQRFIPFMLNLTDGESYRITHSDQLMVTRSTVVIGTQRRNGTRIYERAITCGLIHVVSMVPIEETAVD